MDSSITLFATILIIIVFIVIVWGIYRRYFSLTAKFDRYIQAYVNNKTFSGVVLVAKDGHVLLNKGYGMANYEHMVPNTPQTKFDIASITKQFTAMAIMQLVHAKKLSLNDFVATILPDCPHGKEFTVFQLLTHTAGIPDHDESIERDYTKPPQATGPNTFDYSKPVTIADIIAWLADKPLDFVPGSQFKYSNSGYVVLAAIIEKLSGKSYETFLHENIFKPLGMHNTGVLHHRPLIMHRAQGYHRDGTTFYNAQHYDPSVDIGAGTLYTISGDLYTWDRSLYTNKLLPSELRKQLWQPYLSDYGLGWRIQHLHNRRCILHAGDWFDCSAIILRFVDDDACIIVLSNFDSVLSPVQQIASDLAAILFHVRGGK